MDHNGDMNCIFDKTRIMVKYFFLGLALCCFLKSRAQTSKNDWMVGGNMRINTSENNARIAFTPNVGVFVINNLALGGNFSLDYQKTGNNKFTTLALGPFMRYYFTTETQTVRPLIHTTVNYLTNRTKVGNLAQSTNNGLGYFLGGGAAIFISNNVSIDILLGYDQVKYKNLTGSGGFAFNVGFQVYLLEKQVASLRNK